MYRTAVAASPSPIILALLPLLRLRLLQCVATDIRPILQADAETATNRLNVFSLTPGAIPY
ncbi:MAG: hypothetical protein QOG55_2286 [Acidobacteriaceae bacterium]|jgi:hypothetical protein|nr:hypothetical protein [Acidobacteriaceae bacterium]